MEDSANRDLGSPRRRTSCLPWVLLALVLVPLLALGFVFVTTLGGIVEARQAVNNLLAGRMVMRTDQPSVVVEIRKLNRLETSSFTVEKVVEGGVDRGSALGNVLSGDRLLFIAHGDVIAGVDLSQLNEADISLSGDGRLLKVRLPAAQILSHGLDNEKSRVYDRSTGVLARSDPELETKVRQEAEQQILQAACQGGILAQANANAQSQIRTLLLALHFNDVEFLPARAPDATGCEGV